MKMSIKNAGRIITAAILAAGLFASPLAMQGASAQTPAATDTKKDTKAKRPPTAGQIAVRERAKKCGAEWQAAKAAGKIEKGQKWPQFWSACNKRLKGAA